MTFMATMTRSMLVLTDHSSPSIAFFETRTRLIKRGTINGKLKIDIREKLLFVLEEMAAVSVRIDEKPELPSDKARRNKGILRTLLPMKIL